MFFCLQLHVLSFFFVRFLVVYVVVVVGIYWYFFFITETPFGLMVPSHTGIQALAVLIDRNQLHGHPVQRGNLVVEVKWVFQPGLKPLCPREFGEDELGCEGGFYEWLSSGVSFLTLTSHQQLFVLSYFVRKRLTNVSCRKYVPFKNSVVKPRNTGRCTSTDTDS